MEFTKVLLFKDEHIINNQLRNFDLSKSYFQKYINKLIAIGFEVLENDLLELFENPKAFITQKITTGENLKVGNLTLNKEKLFDLLEKPAGTLELISEIISDQQNQMIRENNIWKVKSFAVENNLVVIKSSEIERIEKQHSLFIETQNQQNGYDKALQIAQLINEINDLAKPNNRISLEDFQEAFFNRDGVFEAKKNIVKRF